MDFLPITTQEMLARGWEAPDFVVVTGDAYVDHPSFGTSVIARLLEREGYRVCILAQPAVDSPQDFTRFGQPKLGFLVSGGNIDSMVAHYTAAKRKRSDDAYTPGGRAGKRPDRAATVYARLCKSAYPHTPVVLGGLEASLRRFAHYDYWADRVLPSILVDSGADLLAFGMGEHQMTEIAAILRDGGEPRDLWGIRGVCYLAPLDYPLPDGHVACASYHKVSEDKAAYARATRLQLEQQDHVYGQTIIQKHGDQLLVQNPPPLPLTTAELDAVAALPFQRYYHPSYEALGGVKAIEEVEFSIIHNRGCFGGCNFCAITFHQGRYVMSRSHQSVVEEAEAMVQNPRFKGYIHDVGGPTANLRGPACARQEEHGVCKGKKCLYPTVCSAIKADHSDYLAMLRKLRMLPGVKKVFVRSGLRFDYILADPNREFLQELVEHHISGQLKVAPEHVSSGVLSKMGKPAAGVYNRFCQEFYATTSRLGKEQYLVPYLMSSHPGSTMADAVTLAVYLKEHRIRPEQVQDFYPTPGTASTCMFYTGLDPMTMEPVYVPTDPYEKKLQRTLLQYHKAENRRLVIEALERAGRRDLIGNDPKCLVAPDQQYLLEQRQRTQRQGQAAGRSQKGQRPGGQPKTGRQGAPGPNPDGRGQSRKDTRQQNPGTGYQDSSGQWQEGPAPDRGARSQGGRGPGHRPKQSRTKGGRRG